MPQLTRPLDILIKKRDGGELSRDEIESFVRAVVLSGEVLSRETKGNGTSLPVEACVSEAQIASFLMAVFQRGLTARKLADFTQAMRFSGEVFDASGMGGFTVDKHSTGGVGDKTSLLIAPILAAAGASAGAAARGVPDALDPALCRETTKNGAPGFPSIYVPMISGRGLGHTGGTLDKLETIPGFDTQLSMARMGAVLRACGAVMMGQTPRLVPADRILYALRDHTGTVESPYLITASIMSKKLAEDLRGLVLDVKVGSGAFMPTYAASKHLAELMVSTGERAGTRTVALLTTMEEPLGRFAGNWVEVWECVDILKGVRHPMSADLIELSLILSGWMLFLAGAGACATPEEGAVLADALLRSGEAYAAWLRIVRAQGGDVAVFEDPAAVHCPAFRRELRAERAGFLAGMDCKQVGWAVQRLGAGRDRPGAPVRAHAGIEVHAKLGDAVMVGQVLFTLFSDDETLLEVGYRMLADTVVVGDAAREREPLVREVVRA